MTNPLWSSPSPRGLRGVHASRAIPAPVWYVVAFLGVSYYAIVREADPWFWSFVILYWVFVGAFLYCYSRVQPFDIFSPVIGLTVLLFLYSLASALFVEATGIIWIGDPISPTGLRIYYVCCLAGLAGLTTGALLGSSSGRTPSAQNVERRRFRRVPPNPAFKKKLIFWSVSLGAVFAVYVVPQFNFLHVAAYSERAFALRVELAADTASGPKVIFLSRLPATLILCAATLVMLTGRRRAIKALGLCVFSAYVVANTLAGWRGAVVTAGLIPVVYYHYRIKPLSVRAAIVGGISLYFFVNAVALVRVSSNPSEVVRLFRENVSSNGLAFARLTSSGELMVGGNLMRLIDGIRAKETGFTYGRSLIDGLLVFVPRSLYRDRPQALSERFVEVFYPGMLESGGGRGLFILQDGYWDFGIPGVFLFMFVYGWVVQKVYLFFMARLSNDLAVFCYSAVYGSLVMGAVRTGIITSMKAALTNTLPFIILWLLIKVRTPALSPASTAGGNE